MIGDIAIIGITGPFGSGKSTAASFFETKGYSKITLSSFLEKELTENKKEITRSSLQDLGNLWRKNEGAGVLAKKALEYISKNKIEKAVIDGIRNLGEVEELKKIENFVLLGIVADRKIRFERIKRMKNREDLTFELFNRLDYRDLGIFENEITGLQVAKCFSVSDFFISNNGEDLEEKLEEFIDKL